MAHNQQLANIVVDAYQHFGYTRSPKNSIKFFLSLNHLRNICDLYVSPLPPDVISELCSVVCNRYLRFIRRADCQAYICFDALRSYVFVSGILHPDELLQKTVADLYKISVAELECVRSSVEVDPDHLYVRRVCGSDYKYICGYKRLSDYVYCRL